MQTIGIMAVIALLLAVVAGNVWWSRHRAKLTPDERRREDAEMERERNLW